MVTAGICNGSNGNLCINQQFTGHSDTCHGQKLLGRKVQVLFEQSEEAASADVKVVCHIVDGKSRIGIVQNIVHGLGHVEVIMGF